MDKQLLSSLSFVHALQIADSALPVGGFAFSNALETAIERGLIEDKDSLNEYVKAIVSNSATLDGIAFLHAFRAASNNQYQRLLDIDNTLSSRRIGQEQQLMAQRMGKKFAELVTQICHCKMLEEWLADVKSKKISGNYTVALAIYLAMENLTEKYAFMLHQYGVAAMVLNAALRLMRISHIQTQQILYSAAEDISQDYQRIKASELQDMSSFAPVFDVLVACHSQGEVRLFMN